MIKKIFMITMLGFLSYPSSTQAGLIDWVKRGGRSCDICKGEKICIKGDPNASWKPGGSAWCNKH